MHRSFDAPDNDAKFFQPALTNVERIVRMRWRWHSELFVILEPQIIVSPSLLARADEVIE